VSHINRRSIAKILQFGFDTVGLIAAWYGTINLRLLLNPMMHLQLTRQELRVLAPPIPALLLLWVAVGLWLRTYRPPRKHMPGDRFANLIESTVLASGLATVATFFFHQFGAGLSRSFILLFMPMCLSCMLWARYIGVFVVSKFERLWPAPERVAVLGSGDEASEIANRVRSAQDSGVMLAGMIIPEDRSSDRQLVTAGPVLGTSGRLAEVINRKRLDRIIVVNGAISDREVDECGVISKRMGVVFNRSVMVPTASLRLEFAERFGLPLLELRPAAFSRRQEIVKRLFDIGLSALALLLLAPVMLFFAALIKLTSKGPAFYTSSRVGRGGRYFTFIKFRSMYTSKMARAHVAKKNEKNGHLFKVKNDPRVTSIGRFMRKYSIDELPQLLNVLRGDMSLVGPRPLPSEDLDPDGQSREFRVWSEQRSRVLPGITGLWQIRGRSDLTFDQMIDLDVDYIRDWSLELDLRILLETPVVVLTGKGAY
jgi:exopolysaccharide biosynthesis polyprenyl glycosylphosphotransferase